MQSLVGKKIVIVDFWTYSCINCQRTLPYINAWYSKYRDQGLEIIGVETPEFDFEKDKTNVQAAIEKFGIKYPVVQDNNYGTWNSYGNRYWPHKYIIDIDGYVAYDHIGEGGYDETEKEIQYLLQERAARLGLSATIESGTVHPAAEVPTGGTSPETYFGSSRNIYLGNGEKGKTGIQNFNNASNEAENLVPNILYLGGAWDVQPEYAKSTGWGSIVYSYAAQRVYFVAHAQTPITVEILRDNKPLTKDQAGEDVVIGPDGKSRVIISTARLYKLIKEQPTDTQHFLQIVTPDAGLEAFTFTFG